MKNLLVNRAVSTAKKNFNLRWLLVPILLIILGVGNVWGTSLTLNNLGESLSSTANTTVATTNITATGDNTSTYTINYYQCKKQSNGGSHAMFLTKSTSPFISNKTAMPGEIQSVTVYILTGAAKGTQYNCAFSTTEITSAVAGVGAETIAGGSNHTYTCSTPGARYFCITLGNASNGQVWKVDVTYTAGGSTKTLSSAVLPVESGSVELGKTSLAPDETTTATATANDGYEFSSWEISGTGASLSSASTNPTTVTMGSADATVTANFSCVTPAFSTNLSTKPVNYTTGASASALTVAASANNASITYLWQSSTNGSSWSSASGTNNTANYTPSTASAGTMYYRCIATNAASGCSTSATSNVATIIVSAPTPATITLQNYDGDATTTGYYSGGSFTLPSENDFVCGDLTFVGWSTVEIANSATKPSVATYHEPGESVTLGASNTFYAVFAEASGSGGGWTRLTNVSQLSAGQQIIMGYEETANSGTIVPVQGSSFGSNLLLTGTTLGSAGSGTITMASNTDGEGYYFTLHEGYNTGYWSFEQSGEQAGKYFGYNNRNAVAQNNSIQTDGKTDYSIILGDNNKATIVNKYGHENTYNYKNQGRYYQYLRYNYNNGNPRVVLYETGMEDLVLFYKNPVSYSNYKTYCDDTKAYVNYNPAGGTTSCTRETVTKGENYTVCSTPPTRNGYTFKGWSDGVTTYNAGGTISNVQNDIVLTAQWTATTYTITYNGVKTGAENTNPTSYTVEDLPINLVAATHDQWRFDGWTDDNAGDADITTIPAGTTGNQSFTAHWTQRYAVTWYEESTPTIEYYDPGATLTFPADPSAPASCSEKKFVGWMVGTITGETDDKPTFITAGEVNADAAYHAVWANAAGSAIAAVEDNTFTQSDVSRATYCGISNGLQSVGKYVQNQSIWNASQMTGVNVKIKVYHVSNDRADVLRISLINSSGEEVVGTDLTTSKLGNSSLSAGYSSNVTLTPTTAVTGYKVSLKTKNSSGTSVGKVTREVVPAYSKYSTSCCDNNVAAPSVTARATRNSITLSWANVPGATGYKVTINGGTHDVTTAACTYTESGLTSGTDYAWTVIATYNPASYCGAIPTKNTTTTLSVYGVTYNKNTTIGSGTVTMSPMPSDASTYVVGENVTAAAKPATCTNSGYTFNGWNTEPDGTGTHVDAGGTIAMVEGGLTLYAEWVAKRAYYVDRMHGQGDQTIEIGGKTYHCYYGDGYHTTPSPSDQKSGDACQAPHYRFVRWLTIGHINADGTQKDTGGAVGGGVQRGTVTDGETYYAIWEEEIE